MLYAFRFQLIKKYSGAYIGGVHLFPFRTEKLSLLGPMVLGGQPPGRVGRRRILLLLSAPEPGLARLSLRALRKVERPRRARVRARQVLLERIAAHLVGAQMLARVRLGLVAVELGDLGTPARHGAVRAPAGALGNYVPSVRLSRSRG